MGWGSYVMAKSLDAAMAPALLAGAGKAAKQNWMRQFNLTWTPEVHKVMAQKLQKEPKRSSFNIRLGSKQ